jgi:hypothetical protein
MARLARLLLSTALFLVASWAAPAWASLSFPPTIQAELGLASPPPCTLCHRNDDGGLGTVVTPFGRTLMNRLGVTAANVNSLKAGLAADKAQNLDSDGDGISDIDELEAGMDPNVGASGEVAGLNVPLPETGCALATRPAFGGTGALAFIGLGLVLVARRSRRVRSILRLAALSGSSFAALACSIDSRQLRYDLPGQAGAESQPLTHAGAGGGARAGAAPIDDAGAAGTDDSAGGAPSARAGSGGAAPTELPLVDGCTDLDGNGVGDCQETLLSNGDFKTDVKGWTADAETVLTWDDQNAAGDLPSGSALLTVASAAAPGGSGSTLRVAKQCVPMTAKQLVTVYANAFVAGGQAAGGHAEIDVYFFDAAACAGTYVTSFSTPQPLDATTDQWLTLLAGSTSGANTQSALVTLALSQPVSAASFAASFDNVLLKKQPL